MKKVLLLLFYTISQVLSGIVKENHGIYRKISSTKSNEFIQRYSEEFSLEIDKSLCGVFNKNADKNLSDHEVEVYPWYEIKN